jgi:DNA-binding Lrp family transcriptional regulator
VKTSLRKELETLGHNVLPELRQGFLTLRAELNGIHEALNVDAAATAARIEKLEEAFKQMVVIMGNINAKIK